MVMASDNNGRAQSSSRSRSGDRSNNSGARGGSRSTTSGRSRSAGDQRPRSGSNGQQQQQRRSSSNGPQQRGGRKATPFSKFVSNIRGRSGSRGRGRSNSAAGGGHARSLSPGGPPPRASPRDERKGKLMANYENYESSRRESMNDGGREDSSAEESIAPTDRSSAAMVMAVQQPRRGGRSMKRTGSHGSGWGRSVGHGNGGQGTKRGFSVARRINNNNRSAAPPPPPRDDEEWADETGHTAETGRGSARSLAANGMSFRSRRRRRQDSNNKSETATTESQFKAHPFILPPYLRLAPRIDVWFAFAIASCASVSSIASIHVQTRGMDRLNNFGAGDKFALSTCCISFVFSMVIAVGMRYAPMRTALTKSLIRSSRNNARGVSRGKAFLAGLNVTVEILLLSLLLVLWIISMPIIVNGNAYYNDSMDVGVPLAMAGSSIWNANLFYSSWASFLLCGYLWIEVHTLSDRRGTLKVDVSNNSSSSAVGSSDNNGLKASNAFSKRWSFLFSASLIVMSASISVYTSPMCQGTLLRQTPYCSRALMGILIGGLFQLLIVLGIGVLYRLSNMSPGVLNSQLRNNRRNSRAVVGTTIMSIKRRNCAASIAAILSLVVQSINAGLLTSPTGGGPGNISGTLYFGSWLGFVLAFELCLRYLEFYSISDRPLSSTTTNRGINLMMGDNVTVFEDEDEEEEDSLLMLRNGPEDEKQQTRANLVGVGKDLSDEDEESFVFPGVKRPPVPQPHLPSAAVRSVRSERSMGRKDSPPSIATNQHFGSARDPDESSSKFGSVARQRRSSRSPFETRSVPSSGSDPVGSIDVKSKRSPGNDEADSKVNDPDGVRDVGIDRKWSGHYNEFEDDYEDLHNSAFFDEQFERANPQSKEPLSKSMMFTSFHMDQIETLEDSMDTNPVEVSPPTPPRHPSNLSPLEEGSGETSPNSVDGSNPSNNVAAAKPNLVGDNLRTMQAMRGVIHQVQQQQQQAAADASKGQSRTTSSSKKSGQASMQSSKSGRSRSRDKGLTNLSAGGMAGASRGMHSSSGGGQVSRNSRHSTASRRTMGTKSSGRSRVSQGNDSAILTDHSEQGGGGGSSAKHSSFKQFSAHDRSKKSAGSRISARSASTLSSRGLSADGSAILTDDDESGSNPPPTISDGMSTKDDLSGFSALSSNKSKSQGPPPPPFRRSTQQTQQQQAHQHQDYNDAASQYSSSAPVRSIHTNKGGSNGETDTIVSDPTLDAGLDPAPPSPKPSRSSRGGQSGSRHRDSSSTNSYDKKYSDETELHRSSSDDNPSSREGEGSNKVVDNIVAAALAYAEKTHGESDNHGLSRVRNSGTSGTASGSGQRRPPQQQSNMSFHSAGAGSHHRTQQQPSTQPQQQRKSTKNLLRLSTASGDASSSLHSFYTESDNGSQRGSGGKGDKSQSTGNPRYAAAAPVDDLVAKALSHAQGHMDGKHQNSSQHSTQQRPAPQRTKSEYSSNAGKSVGSMYSEDDTEFSNQDVGMHFDC